MSSFAGMSALVKYRSKKVAQKLSRNNLGVNAVTEQQSRFD